MQITSAHIYKEKGAFEMTLFLDLGIDGEQSNPETELLFASGATEGPELQRQTEILEIIVKAIEQYNEKSED